MSKDFALYDQRHYTTLDVVEGYALWSKTYDAQMTGQLDCPLLERLSCVDWRAMKSCLDFACGSGRIGQWLARERGVAAIDGVDISPEMLTLARARGVYRRVVEADIQATTLDGPYDGGVCSMASCHLPELQPLYQEAARLIRPGGHFMLADFHQHFLLKGIPTHFPREGKEPAAIRNYVHFISDHFAAGAAAHWRLVDLRERFIDSAWVAAEPGMASHEHLPVVFLLVWQKNR
jgi:SAM-dependent methyltransferase